MIPSFFILFPVEGKSRRSGGGGGVRLTWHAFLKLKKQNICSAGKKRKQIKDCSHEVKTNEWIEVKTKQTI